MISDTLRKALLGKQLSTAELDGAMRELDLLERRGRAQDDRLMQKSVYDPTADGSVDTLGGVPADYFVQGNGPNRDLSMADPNVASQSGFWESPNSANNPGGDANWYHILQVRHSNVNNHFAVQFAQGYFDDAKTYIRNVINGTIGPWNKLWHGGNDGVGSGLDADLLDGLQTGIDANKIAFINQYGALQATYLYEGADRVYSPGNHPDWSVITNRPNYVNGTAWTPTWSGLTGTITQSAYSYWRIGPLTMVQCYIYSNTTTLAMTTSTYLTGPVSSSQSYGLSVSYNYTDNTQIVFGTVNNDNPAKIKMGSVTYPMNKWIGIMAWWALW